MNDKGERIVFPLCFPIPQFCAIMGYHDTSTWLLLGQVLSSYGMKLYLFFYPIKYAVNNSYIP